MARFKGPAAEEACGEMDQQEMSGATGFDAPLWAFVTRSCVRVQSCGGSRSFVAAGAPDRLNARARPGPAESSSRAHGCGTW